MTLNKIAVHSTNTSTDLCKLGALYQTDKSPWNTRVCAHSYTPFYELIFSNLRHREIVFGEIGCWMGNSARMWRDWFTKAEIYTWDRGEEFVNNTKSYNLENVTVDYIDVADDNSVINAFNKVGKKFDVIVDDSSHEAHDHLRLINLCHKFLNPGGILVIEDLYRSIPNSFYEEGIERLGVSKYYSTIAMVEPEHEKADTAGWNNDKLIFLVRNNE